MNKRNLIISITIITLALGAGGFYFWSQKKADLTQNKVESQKSKAESQKLGMNIDTEKQKQIVGQNKNQEQEDIEEEKGQTQNQEQNQKQSNTNSDIKYNPDGTIDTSDWKTYRNEEFGFEFKYPNKWWVEKIPNKTDTFLLEVKPLNNDKEFLRFVINVFKSQLTAEDWYKKNSGRVSSNIQEFKTSNDFYAYCNFAGKDALQRDIDIESICVLKKNNTIILISFGAIYTDRYNYFNYLPQFKFFVKTIKSIK